MPHYDWLDFFFRKKQRTIKRKKLSHKGRGLATCRHRKIDAMIAVELRLHGYKFLTSRRQLSYSSIGLYRDVWIAAIASSTTSLATRTAAICVRFQGRRVRRVYVTMQITFLTRKSALIYRRGLRQRVASITLNCNGDFAIRAYSLLAVQNVHIHRYCNSVLVTSLSTRMTLVISHFADTFSCYSLPLFSDVFFFLLLLCFRRFFIRQSSHLSCGHHLFQQLQCISLPSVISSVPPSIQTSVQPISDGSTLVLT